MKRLLPKIDHVFGRIAGLATVFSMLAAVTMMVLVAVDVFTAAFRHPIKGLPEVVVMVMVVLVFLGIPECARDDEMIKIDIFRRLPILDHVWSIVIFGLGLLICWQTVVQGVESFRLAEASVLLRIPKWPFLLVTAFGFFMLAVGSLVLEFRRIVSNQAGESGDRETSIEDGLEAWRDEYGITHRSQD